MKRYCLIFHLGVLVLLGATLTVGQEATRSDAIINPRLCDVENTPESFLDKTVKVSAVYTAGYEMGWLSAPIPCSTLPKFRIRYLFDDNYLKTTDRKVVKRFKRLMSKDQYPKTMRGIFEIVIRPYVKANASDVRFDYDVRVMRIVSLNIE